MKTFAILAVLAVKSTRASSHMEFDASSSLAAGGVEILRAGQVYRHRQTVSVPIPHLQGEVDVELEANLDLFSPDWYAETYDPASGDRGIERNVEQFQCHYTGQVKGYPDSVAAISICDGIGMRGEIMIPDVAHVEIYPNTESCDRQISNLGVHIVHNATKTTTLEHGEPQQPEDDGVAPSGAGNDAPSQQNTYMNNGVFATDISRVNRLGSTGDLQQTQSLVNRAQAIYTHRNNNWRSANPNHRIAVQPQAPNGWDQRCTGSGSDYLTRCRDYYRNQHGSRDNIQCLQEGCPNSALGWGYMNAMCGSSSAGWTRMLINDDRENADTIAHEMGHNYGFDHESGRVCMGSGQDPWFGNQSANRWEQVRNNYSCLR